MLLLCNMIYCAEDLLEIASLHTKVGVKFAYILPSRDPNRSFVAVVFVLKIGIVIRYVLCLSFFISRFVKVLLFCIFEFCYLLPLA
uniref:Putative ovule protein n=1 Tax=Solanum chacoense TaxID=4108 RepID=A0A0V0GPD0_SOLCH